MKNLFIISACIFLNICSFSQGKKNFVSNRPSLFCGLTIGYKSYCGSFSMIGGIRIYKYFELNFNGGANRFEGGAIGIGCKLNLLKNKKYYPFIGINYDKHYKGGFSIGEVDSLTSHYRTLGNKILLPQIGCYYEEEGMSIFFSLNYKIPLLTNKLILVGGPGNAIEDRAERIYKPGIGFTIGIIAHYWEKRNLFEKKERYIEN